MSLLVSEEVILASKSPPTIDTSSVVAEELMLPRLVDSLVPSQVFGRDETFATDSTYLGFGTVPPGVMTSSC